MLAVAFFVLKTKIDGVVAGMEKHLAINLMGSAYSNWLRIIHAVINQAGPDALQGRAARRFGQTDHCLHLQLRGPRNFIRRFARAYRSKLRQQNP